MLLNYITNLNKVTCAKLDAAKSERAEKSFIISVDNYLECGLTFYSGFSVYIVYKICKYFLAHFR